jgi:LysM domain
MRRAYLAFVMAAPVFYAGVAWAQNTGAPPPPGGGGGTQGGGGGGAPGGGPGTGTVTTVGPPVVTTYPGGVAPTAPGQPLGGGNTEYSSSRPILGPNDRDTFDFGKSTTGGTVHGAENGSFVLGGHVSGSGEGVSNPGVHVVHRGDTLWAICDYYFRNPYQWPRIWSYNPQIQNPHWIYPGDQVRLRGGAEVATVSEPSQTQGLVDRRRQVPPDTVFLRNQGFIEDEKDSDWGEINGSPEDKMFLSEGDSAYLRISSAHDLKMGQELTVYRYIKDIAGGKLIEIQGTVRIDQWNPKEHVGRARITESLDAIERGARVGPVARRFEVVPPTRDDVDVQASVLTMVHPYILFGQNQVVFIDKGEEAGLKPGNRLLVLKKGDAWHDSLTTKGSALRIAQEDNDPAATELVPRPRSDDVLPEEVQAELRVINVKKKTAMCLVTSSRREIEAGDQAFARKGY